MRLISQGGGDYYIGTEHLFPACLALDSRLLGDRSAEVALLFMDEKQALGTDVQGTEPGDKEPDLPCPSWAAKCVLRVEDFPADLADDAPLIVECMAIYSGKKRLQNPAFRYALAHRPRDPDELRMRLVEYFCKLGRRG